MTFAKVRKKDILRNLVLILSFFVLFGTTKLVSAASSPYRFASQLPTNLNYFAGPVGVTLDQAGNLYVADMYNSRIEKISPDGNVRYFGQDGTGEGQLNRPRGIAVDQAGNMYVADTSNSRIQKISPTGEFQVLAGYGTEPGQFCDPMGMAIDQTGNIYIADYSNHRIQKLSPEGTPLQVIGSLGNLPGQLTFPYGVAVDQTGNIYVSDFGNDRIQKFNAAGMVLEVYGSTGSETGQLSGPFGITVDLAGNIFVADSNNNRIQKISPSGEFQAIGSPGSEPGQLSYPNGIAVDGVGNLYIADTYNDRVQKLGPDGTALEVLSSWGTALGRFNFPAGVVIDQAGNIYVADSNNNRLQKISPSGTIEIIGSYGSDPGQFAYPTSLAMDQAGNIYIGDGGNGRIQKMSPAGEFQVIGSAGSDPGQFSYPSGIAIDQYGNIYVTDSNNNRVQKFSPEGDFLQIIGNPGSDPSPEPGTITWADGIAVDQSGNIYVSDSGNNRIQKFSPSGEVLQVIGGSDAGSEPGQFDNPKAVMVDAEGNIYVADTGNNRIQKINSEGTVFQVIGSFGLAPGQFHNPHGIALDQNGNLYVADSENHRIQKFVENLPPTWPGGTVSTTDVTKNGLTLNWTPALDNVGVDSYSIYREGNLLATVAANVYSYDVTGLTALTQYNFKVEAGDAAGNWSADGPSVTVTTAAAANTHSGGNSSSAPTDRINLTGYTTEHLVNQDGQIYTTVELNEAYALTALKENPAANTAFVVVNGKTADINLSITGRLMESMGERQTTLEVHTKAGSYLLPTGEIDLGDLTKRLGRQSAEIKINIIIGLPTNTQTEAFKSFTQNHDLELLGTPLDFKLEAAAGQQKVEINRFGRYVSREINLPASVKVENAVGVVLNSDGSLSPVPTQFQTVNGQTIAVLKRKSNSIYAVISNQKTFGDITKHWAAEDINTLASKLIITGMQPNVFAPDAKITRAQLAALIVRGLGLELNSAQAARFTDVHTGDWYAGAVGAAYSEGIIKGYPDGSFRPNARVTRLEAAAMLLQVMKIAGKDMTVSHTEINQYLAQFQDQAEIANWAKDLAAGAVKLGIMRGNPNGTFAPAQGCTRAEVAVMLRKILMNAELM